MAAKGVELAAAYISLGINTESIGPDLKKALNDSAKYADEAGRQAGQKLSSAVASEMSRGSARIGKKLADDVGGGGRQAGQKFFDEFKTPAERTGATIGLVLGRSIGTAIDVGRIGSNIGAGLARSLGGAFKTALGGLGLGTALAGVGGIGYVLTKGFERLQSIDQAKFKLQALGHSAAEVQSIMKSALESVQGTSFNLGDAASAAASAVAAGIEPGKQLTAYLHEIGDAAAIANTGFDEMAHIFNKVRTQNKAFTDDLQMLSDRGVPIFKWLQDQYHVTGAELSKMVQNGQVDAASFEKAINDHIGGAALKMGDSFSGAVEKAQAAMSRIGAAFLAPIFGQATGGLGSLTGELDKLEGWMNSHQGSIIDFWATLGHGAVDAAEFIMRGLGFATKTVADFMTLLARSKEFYGRLQADMGGFTGDKGREAAGNKMMDEARQWEADLDKLRHTGDDLANKTFPEMDAKINAWADRAKGAAQFTQDLGGAIVTLNGTAVVLKDNTPEVLDHIDKTKFEIQHMSDGTVKLVPKTQEATAEMDAWRAQQNNIPLTLHAGLGNSIAEMSGQLSNLFSQRFNLNVNVGGLSGTGTAQGGINQGWSPFGPYVDTSGLVGTPNMSNLIGNIPGMGTAGAGGAPFNAGPQAPNRGGGNIFGGGPPTGLTGGGGGNALPPTAAPSGFKPPAGSGPEGWRPLVQSQLAQYGPQFGITNTKAWEDAIIRQIGTESSGDPGAVNNYDSNAAAGTPSKGLLQFIQPTFAANNVSGGNFMDPAAQIAAIIPYVKNRWGIGADGSPNRIGRGTNYDQGGVLPPGYTVVMNATGQPELVLNPQQQQDVGAAIQGPPQNPGAVMPGLPGGAPQDPNAPQDPGAARTQGYIPAAAGSTAVAGTSAYAGFLNMGAEAINGLIDQAASMGGGAANAVAPGAGMAISMGAGVAKRAVSYGFQMAGIAGDALIEQLFPFGAPRWIGSSNPTAFMPQMPGQKAAVTTGEKAQAATVQRTGFDPNMSRTELPPQPFDPGGPVQPNQMPGAGGEPPTAGPPKPGSLPAPGQASVQPSAAPGAGTPGGKPLAGLGGAAIGMPGANPAMGAPGAATPSGGTLGIGAPQAPGALGGLNVAGAGGFNPLSLLFDDGGILEPGMVGVNMSKQPEPVFSGAQWKNMEQAAANHSSGGHDFSVTFNGPVGGDANDIARQIQDKQRLAVMQYAGRPFG